MKVGVAVSRRPEVRAAAREAAERALSLGGIGRATCLFVGGTVDHLDQSIDLCEELRAVAGASVQIVGAAVGSVLLRGDSREDGSALGILALEGPVHAFAWHPDDGAQLRAAAQAQGPGALAGRGLTGDYKFGPRSGPARGIGLKPGIRWKARHRPGDPCAGPLRALQGNRTARARAASKPLAPNPRAITPAPASSVATPDQRPSTATGAPAWPKYSGDSTRR